MLAKVKDFQGSDSWCLFRLNLRWVGISDGLVHPLKRRNYDFQSELSESLRLFIDLEDTKSFLLILDIPNFRYALLSDPQKIEDENSVKEFLHKFQTSQLQYKYIQSRFI